MFLTPIDLTNLLMIYNHSLAFRSLFRKNNFLVYFSPTQSLLAFHPFSLFPVVTSVSLLMNPLRAYEVKYDFFTYLSGRARKLGAIIVLHRSSASVVQI